MGYLYFWKHPFNFWWMIHQLKMNTGGTPTNQACQHHLIGPARCEIPRFWHWERPLPQTKTRRVVFVEPALYLLEKWWKKPCATEFRGLFKNALGYFFFGVKSTCFFFFVFFEYERDWTCYIKKSKSSFFGKCHKKNMFRIYVYNYEYLHMYLQCLIIPHMFCEVVCFKEITFLKSQYPFRSETP